MGKGGVRQRRIVYAGNMGRIARTESGLILINGLVNIVEDSVDYTGFGVM